MLSLVCYVGVTLCLLGFADGFVIVGCCAVHVVGVVVVGGADDGGGALVVLLRVCCMNRLSSCIHLVLSRASFIQSGSGVLFVQSVSSSLLLM